MQKLLIGAFAAASVALVASDAFAHGGTYRGPGDTVPPGAGGGGSGGPPPTTGGPQGPAPEAPKGPKTPPPSSGPPVPGGPPGGGGKGPTTGAPTDTSTDLTLWSFWWEFNKDPFLNLKAAIHSAGTTTGSSDFFLGDGEQSEARDTYKPSEDQIRGEIVPALLRALETETNNDIVTGCLIALAKIGDVIQDGGESEFSDVISKFLKDPNQEISETAALSLGILANSSEVNLARLEGLMADKPSGRQATGNPDEAVSRRTRTFAAYGLGLVGARAQIGGEPNVRARIVQSFADGLVPAERESTQDLAAAIVISMGLVPLEASGTWPLDEEIDPAKPGKIDTVEKQIALLMAVFDNDRYDRYMRAHVPTAVARLLRSMDGRSDLPDHRRKVKQSVAEMLLLPLDPRKGGKFEEEVQQSCALALGLVGDADQDDIDVEIRKVLADADKLQRQAKNFTLIALSKIATREGEAANADGEAVDDDDRFKDGRKDVSKHLQKRLESGKAGEEHYAGIGIGVMNWQLRQDAKGVDTESIFNLRSALEKSKAVEDIGAFAISAGIAGDEEAKKALERFLDKTTEPVAQGYVALSLGLLGIVDAQESIKLILQRSEYKADLLKQAAIALGLLGDKETVPLLVQMLKEAKTLSTQASLASALGFIGDRRSVTPLVEMLEDKTLTETARGFAAVALGIVADKEPLPFNSKIAVDLNYRASLPTLNTQDGKGILNIL
ncbi:MAG: HEAT repeat domain-containing protein [Planctomycetota bacterium]